MKEISVQILLFDPQRVASFGCFCVCYWNIPRYLFQSEMKVQKGKKIFSIYIKILYIFNKINSVFDTTVVWYSVTEKSVQV